MTYRKPANVKYTDMCIYIDNTIYTEDKDDNLIFEYLYHLSVMFASKYKYFTNKEYLDNFGIFAATYFFLRLTNERQFLEDNHPKKLDRIKSILNYIKQIIYAIKVQFEQSEYYQSINDDVEICVADSTIYTYRNQLQETLDRLNRVEFNLYLEEIPKVIEEFLQNIPHIKNSNEWLNIYTSCLLTLLNSITMSNSSKRKLLVTLNSNSDPVAMCERIYKREQEDNIILFHLDESYRNYISVLIQKLKHIIASNLSSNLYTYIPSANNFDNIMTANLQEFDNDY